MLKLNTYIMFEGNAEEAMTFYQSVLGGEVTHTMRYKDMPADANAGENSVSEDMLDKIMHMQLEINDNMTLMANDNAGEYGPLKKGNQYAICISPDSEDEARRIYESLSNGGEIMMPLEEQFWGSLFAMFVDKYGVDWLIEFELDKG